MPKIHMSKSADQGPISVEIISYIIIKLNHLNDYALCLMTMIMIMQSFTSMPIIRFLHLILSSTIGLCNLIIEQLRNYSQINR